MGWLAGWLVGLAKGICRGDELEAKSHSLGVGSFCSFKRTNSTRKRTDSGTDSGKGEDAGRIPAGACRVVSILGSATDAGWPAGWLVGQMVYSI